MSDKLNPLIVENTGELFHITADGNRKPLKDESRLLPTGGRNGNLLEYQEGADRGNNVNTKLLLQPATSDGLIVDQAAGNAAPVSITNSGNVVVEDNALVFTGTNSLLIPANALGMTLGGNNEFTIDIEFQLDSVKSDYATLYGADGGGSGYQGALYFTSGGAAHFTLSLGPDTTGWTLGTKHRITIERWNDNGTWKTSVYRNGSFLASSTSGMNILSDYVFPIGSNNESTNRNFIGKIWAFRISNKAEHRGVSFTPRELPFLPPAGQPVWTEGIDRSRLLPALDTLPEGYTGNLLEIRRSSGSVADANTLRLMHFDEDTRDVVTKETGALNGGATIVPTGYFSGALSVNSNTISSLVFGGLSSTPESWTIDFRVKLASFSGDAPQVLFGTNLNETQTSLIRVSSSYIDIQATYNQRVIYQEHSLQLNVWYHFALTYDGNAYKFYIDGNLFGTGESDKHFDFTRKLWFGSFYDYSTSYVSNCMIDEFRLSNAVRWTENFTPPDKPYGESLYNWGIGPKLDESRLLPENAGANELAIKRIGAFGIDGNTHLMLHFDEESGIPADSSQDEILVTANDTAADAATAKFGKARNLNNSYLSLTCPAMSTETGDFTYEGWFYFNELNKRRGLFGVDMGLYVALWGDNTFGVAISTSGSSWNYNHMDSNRSEATATQGVWQHIALVRNKGNVTLYLNGNSILSFDIGADTVITGNMGNNSFRIGYPLGGMSSIADFCDEFRFSTVARWTGNFTPPEKAYTVGTESWDPISISGLRDELMKTGVVGVSNPANGDIPCFDATATIGGGNDANTRLLLQPSTSDHGIVDQAAGNAAPVTLENHNVTVDEEGNMVFDGSNAYLKIPANTLPSDFFNGTDEWTLDIVYNVTSKGRQCLFGCSSSLRMDFLLDSDGSLQIGAGPNLGTGWPFNEDVHLTFEIYKDGTVWKYTIFRNGSVVTTGTWVNADWRSVAQYIGWEGGTDSRKINGKIKALRLTSGALHKGAAFQSDYPWTRPQTVGEWSKLNKSNLVLKSDLPSPKEDIVFTSSSLSNSKLTVENATVGTFAILDNSNSLVMPNMKQVGTSVEIDFTGWTITGNWTLKFVSNTSVSGGGGGVTKDEATSIAIEAAIIFG